MSQEENCSTKHARANREYLKGNYAEAVRWQAEVVNDQIKDGKRGATARKLLALYLYSSGEIDAAVTLLKTLFEETPNDSEVPENIGVMLRQAGKIEDSVEYLHLAHRMSPEKPNICDGLAHSYNTLKKPDRVQEFGRRSLVLKDEAVKDAKSWLVPQGAPPIFNREKRERNILSFSLFGDGPRYLHGALRNARLADDLYPGWTCRFYCDPRVPRAVIEELKELGCEIVMRSRPERFYEGLLWRFEVIDDPSIDRFLVRDCDSVINIKERVAVDAWLASDKWFHMMRDFPSHTELILAGMWGGISGVLPSIETLNEEFPLQTAPTRTYDQQLLRNMVWPTMRKSVLIHDSVYTGCLSSVPFPEVGTLPPGRHVGQNEAAVIDRRKLVAGPGDRVTPVKRFFVAGMNHGGTLVLRNLLNLHSGIHCPARHHLSTLWKNSDRSARSYGKVFEEINQGGEAGSIDSKSIRKELFAAWMEHLFTNYGDDSVSHVGITDHNLDSNFDYHAERNPDAKFLFITRDPRDLLVSWSNYKKRKEPGFDRDQTRVDELAKTIAAKWVQKLKNVQAFNREEPGRIELVRFEDLVSGGKRIAALSRIFQFLEIPISPESVKKLFEEHELLELKASAFGGGTGYEHKSTVGKWEDSLSIAQIDLIQKTRRPAHGVASLQDSADRRSKAGFRGYHPAFVIVFMGTVSTQNKASHHDLGRRKIEALFAVGYQFQQSGQFLKAIGAFQEVLRRDPKHDPAHNNLGNCLRSIGCFEESIAHYEETLSLAPRKNFARLNKGLALLALNRYEEAWPLYRHRLDVIDYRSEVLDTGKPEWGRKGTGRGPAPLSL